MKDNQPPIVIKPAARFEQHAASVLLDLRSAVAAVLSAVPGLGNAPSATDVQRVLKTNSKLSWQVHKFATTTSPIDVAPHIPKRAAMKRFCDAARKQSVARHLLEQVMMSFDRFEQLVDRHAGDRLTFDSMIGGLGGAASSSQLNQQHRREAYRAQSHVWGVQAKTMISLMIFRAAKKPGCVDGITVGGYVNLRRFRHDARWILFGRCVASDKQVINANEAQPLNFEDYERYGAPLMSKFCSFSPGSFRMLETDSHVRYIEASEDDIGNNAAATYLSGELWRDVAYTVADDQRWLLARARVRIPTEILYHDVMIHRDLPVEFPPALDHFGDLRSGDDALSHSESERLPVFDSITHIGGGVNGCFAPEYTQYPELAKYSLEAAGWDPSEFNLYRCRMAYPVLPSTVVMRFRAQ